MPHGSIFAPDQNGQPGAPRDAQPTSAAGCPPGETAPGSPGTGTRGPDRDPLRAALAYERSGELMLGAGLLVRQSASDPSLALEAVRMLLRGDRLDEALRSIRDLPDDIKTDPEWLVVTGQCLERRGDVDLAADCVRRARQQTLASVFLLLLEASLRMRQNEPDEAERILRNAVSRYPAAPEAQADLGALLWATGRQEEGWEFLRVAFLLDPTKPEVVGAFVEAARVRGCLPDALGHVAQANGRFPDSCALLRARIQLLALSGQTVKALEASGEYLGRFGPDDGVLDLALELRASVPVEKTTGTSRRPAVTLTMIARDEERNIARCLWSAKGIADEIIVVDTGSTDRTREIAAVFGAGVSTFRWTGDFAAARNASLEKARGRWILVLDPDENIAAADVGRLMDLVRSAPRRAFSFVTRNYVEAADTPGWVRNDGSYSEEAGTGWIPSSKIRLFPRDGRIRWQDRVHESVDAAVRAAGYPVVECPIPVHHYGKLDSRRTERKGEMYLAAGLQKLRETGGDVNATVELARQASELGRHAEALDWWRRVMGAKPADAEAHAGAGSALAMLERYDEAAGPLEHALSLDPARKEAAVQLAIVRLHLGDAGGAKLVAERLVDAHPGYPFAPAILAAALFCLGENDRGLLLLDRLRADGVGYAGFFLDLASRLTRGGRAGFSVTILESISGADGPTPELAAVLVEGYKALALA